MLRILGEKSGSLAGYLRPDYVQTFTPTQMTEREKRVMRYLSDSSLTSYADVLDATILTKLATNDLNRIVFVGSAGSNPWVTLFQSRLNFIESEGTVGESVKFFHNEHPLAGEQNAYKGLAFTGTSGEDYATIALLPGLNGRGNVLLLQGLQQEGTEAAGRFLANAEDRQHLRESLHIPNFAPGLFYFEILLRIRAIDGTPNEVSIVATRLIKP